jgi:hypothetical protein
MEKLSNYTRFKLTNNSKVRFNKKHYNTFSLKQGSPKNGGTCPGATQGACGCEDVCYDKNLRKLYKAYAAVEDYNTSLVKNKSPEEIYTVINNSVTWWLLNGGETDPYFRIHTGGDFYNEMYTRCWKQVIEEHPGITFWVYTRSLFAIPILIALKNLTLFLSCDQVNQKEVLAVYEEYRHHSNLAVAWMGNTLPKTFPKDRQYLVCPEVSGKFKNNNEQGACSRCRACINRPLKNGQTRHIQFPIHR